jgi:hypothetical protein
MLRYVMLRYVIHTRVRQYSSVHSVRTQFVHSAPNCLKRQHPLTVLIKSAVCQYRFQLAVFALSDLRCHLSTRRFGPTSEGAIQDRGRKTRFETFQGHPLATPYLCVIPLPHCRITSLNTVGTRHKKEQ